MNRQEILDEMTAAVKLNMQYLKRAGMSRLALVRGRLHHSSGDVFFYDFEIKAISMIDTNATIFIEVYNDKYPVTVGLLNNTAIQVGVKRNLGESITSARLLFSNCALHEKLVEYLPTLKSGKYRILDVVLGVEKAKIRHDKQYKQQVEDRLNIYQERAIAKSLGSDVTFIWGPPGTGKSATIARLSREFIDRGKTVLVVAHTNVAIDSLLSGIVGVMSNHPAYKEGKILRVGNQGAINQELQDKLVTSENITQELCRDVIAEKQKCEKEEAALKSSLVKVRAIYAFQELQAIQSRIKKCAEIRRQLQEDLYNTNLELDNYKNKIKLYQWFFYKKIRRLETRRIACRTDLGSVEMERAELSAKEHNYNSIVTEYEKASSDDIASIARATYVSDDAIDRKEQRLESIRKAIIACDQEIQSIEKNIFKNARMIATTITKTYTDLSIVKRRFDVVIIDEASMAQLTGIVCAAVLARESMVMVGDFLQLPPIVKHGVINKKQSLLEHKLIDRWLRRDVFNFSGIEHSIMQGKAMRNDWMSQLRIQYRMHPDISHAVNMLVYASAGEEHTLIDHESTYTNGDTQLDIPPLAGLHIGVCDTSSVGSVASKNENNSTYNLLHAIIAIDIAKNAVDHGVGSVGIISAYRAQVDLINAMLADDNQHYLSCIEVDTVHRFQGGAKEVVILDITTPQSHTMYDNRMDHTAAKKLINVAVSRARNKFILLANRQAVLKRHGAESLVRALLRIIELKKGAVVDIEYGQDQYNSNSSRQKIKNSITHDEYIDEESFYARFCEDIRSAERQVVIASPFITLRRIDILLPVITEAIARNVKVDILTRVLDDHDNNIAPKVGECIQKLKGCGVCVVLRPDNFHEKFAIIDGSVSYIGSLNILSQRRSTELMLRRLGENSCKALAKLYKIDLL